MVPTQVQPLGGGTGNWTAASSDVSSLPVAMLAMQLPPSTTCTAAKDETGTHIVSCSVSRYSPIRLLAAAATHTIVYMSWDASLPLQNLQNQGMCQAGLGLAWKNDGAVCRDPTCHLSRPETHRPGRASVRLCTGSITSSQSAAGCCAEQSGWPSAYRFVEPGRCSVSMVRRAAFETLSLLAAHRVCAFPWERRK